MAVCSLARTRPPTNSRERGNLLRTWMRWGSRLPQLPRNELALHLWRGSTMLVAREMGTLGLHGFGSPLPLS